MDFIIGGAAVVIIALLLVRLDAVSSQRNYAQNQWTYWQGMCDRQARRLAHGQDALAEARDYLADLDDDQDDE